MHCELNIILNVDYYNLSFGSRKGLTKPKNIVTAFDTYISEFVTVTKFCFDSNTNLIGVNKGKICVTKLNKNKLIEPLALNEYIENGWELGKHISKIIVTNGEKNIFINPIDEEFYNKQGYFRGRTIKKSVKHIWVNNGLDEKMIRDYDNIEDGWIKGRIYTINRNKTLVSDNGVKRYVEKSESHLYEKVKLDRCWVMKGDTDKLIEKSKLNDYIIDGWMQGKNLTGDKNNLTGRVIYNNGKITKMIKKDEEHDYIKNGWFKGRLKNEINKSYS